MKNIKLDIKGKKFGYLTAIKPSFVRDDNTYWECLCVCGKTSFPARSSLIAGYSKSCGCKRVEQFIYRNTSHGLSKTKIYKVWAAMIDRCINLNNRGYPNYGGRGISFDPKWKHFEMFYKDMGSEWKKGKTLDRINNDKSYNKKNCRWITHKEQQGNKRQTIFVNFHGKLYCAKHLFDQYGIKKNTGYYRLKSGWPIEKVLNIK